MEHRVLMVRSVLVLKVAAADTNLDESGPSDEDDTDMYACGEDFKIFQKPSKKSYEIECESLSQGQVEKMLADIVDHISDIFGVDVSYSDTLIDPFNHISRLAPLLCYSAISNGTKNA